MAILRRSALVCALATTTWLASCGYDFDAPFDGDGASPPDAEGGVEGEGGPSPDGSTPTSDAPPLVCDFADDYAAGLGNPRMHFRFDEASGPFASIGTVPLTGTREAGVERIARGALRSTNGGQRLGGKTIAFGNNWYELNGGLHAPLALELWFRPRTNAAQTLFSKSHDRKPNDPQGYRVTIGADGLLRFERFADEALRVDIGRAEPNRWHHLVVQHTNTSGASGVLGFFLDGTAVSATDTDAATFAANAADPFVLGPFDGDVDELVAHGRALVQADVDARMDAATGHACNAGKTAVCLGPEGRATCSGKLPKWSASCAAGEVCVLDGSETRCAPDTCPR